MSGFCYVGFSRSVGRSVESIKSVTGLQSSDWGYEFMVMDGWKKSRRICIVVLFCFGSIPTGKGIMFSIIKRL